MAWIEYGLVAVAVVIAGAYLARNMYRTFAGKSPGCHCPKSGECSTTHETSARETGS